jgi:hypothetical protein
MGDMSEDWRGRLALRNVPWNFCLVEYNTVQSGAMFLRNISFFHGFA